jgi:transposase-like protein
MGDSFDQEGDSDGTCPNTPPGDETFWDICKDWGLDDRQIQAIELTVGGLSETQVAQQLGINRRTLWRWRTYNADYRAALLDARMHAFSTIGDAYQGILHRAAKVMAELLDDPQPANRYRAAQTLITMSGSFRPRVTKQLMEFKPKMPEPDLPEKMG